MRHSRLIAPVLCLLVSAPDVCLALGPRKAMYVTGTLRGLPDKAEGKRDITNPNALVFIAEKGATLSIRWASIQELEYGRRAPRGGRTAAVMKALSVFSRGPKHFVTITYRDHVDKEQVVLFEFGDEIIRPTLTALREKSRKPLVCQDQEAASQAGGACDSVLVAVPPQGESGK